MKDFLDIVFSPTSCRKELDEFKQLLDGSPELSEAADLLPFFRQRTQLASFLGSRNLEIVRPDAVAYEYPLYGDLRTDIIAADTKRRAFVFVELEDARKESVFARKTRHLPEWSKRFEHGFGQIVDWFWKLRDFTGTADFENRFGSRTAIFTGLLVAGRSSFLSKEDFTRLEWRRRNVQIDGLHVYCCTYDELYEELDDRLRMIEAV